jgi:hypothetical protein
MGVFFQGSEGWIAVSRQTMETYPESLKTARFGSGDIRLPRSDDHRRDFFNAVRSRRDPISNIESAVRSDTVCQQADIAMRLPRKLRWDPVAERFIGDPRANRMLSRPMRGPWHL